MCDLAVASLEFHRPWVSAPRNHEEFVAYLQRIESGRTIAFLVRHTEGRRISGVVNLNEPVMGSVPKRLSWVLRSG